MIEWSLVLFLFIWVNYCFFFSFFFDKKKLSNGNWFPLTPTWPFPNCCCSTVYPFRKRWPSFHQSTFETKQEREIGVYKSNCTCCLISMRHTWFFFFQIKTFFLTNSFEKKKLWLKLNCFSFVEIDWFTNRSMFIAGISCMNTLA